MNNSDINDISLRIAGIVNDSVVDGPGLRLAVFAQGCPHRCDGCHNPLTHDADGGYVIFAREIIDMLDANPLLDGVTFSGGDPLLQWREFAAVAKEVKRRGLSVMAYTGYLWEEIYDKYNKYNEYAQLLENIDILVDGRFIKEKKSYKLRYRGSKNQRIIDVAASLDKGGMVCLYNLED